MVFNNNNKLVPNVYVRQDLSHINVGGIKGGGNNPRITITNWTNGVPTALLCKMLLLYTRQPPVSHQQLLLVLFIHCGRKMSPGGKRCGESQKNKKTILPWIHFLTVWELEQGHEAQRRLFEVFLQAKGGEVFPGLALTMTYAPWSWYEVSWTDQVWVFLHNQFHARFHATGACCCCPKSNRTNPQ